MAQVSVGQVENLEDLLRGLDSVRDALETACLEQIALANVKLIEAGVEAQDSGIMLDNAYQTELEAQEELEAAEAALDDAISALSDCQAYDDDDDEDDGPPDCSSEEADVQNAEAYVTEARAKVEQARENHRRMEQRVEYAKQALLMAEKAFELVQSECASRLASVCRYIEIGTARLRSAQQSLEAYLSSNPSAGQFYTWLHWNPEQGKPVTPDLIRDRINIPVEQQRLLQEYLYDRNTNYRNLVDSYRSELASANGDVERNMVNRNICIHLSGGFAEHMARYALAPLGGTIETQGRTYVGNDGGYTKTDLIVMDLRVPVILGRGENMGAPAGGSLAFEVKCGREYYLYNQKDHMVFQAEGHKKADAHCTLCSRDIHNLTPEQEKELREALRNAGSPIVGMLPEKEEIDSSCIEFVRQNAKGEKNDSTVNSNSK